MVLTLKELVDYLIKIIKNQADDIEQLKRDLIDREEQELFNKTNGT